MLEILNPFKSFYKFNIACLRQVVSKHETFSKVRLILNFNLLFHVMKLVQQRETFLKKKSFQD